MMVTRLEIGGTGEMLKGTNLQLEDVQVLEVLINNIVIIVNHNILHTSLLKDSILNVLITHTQK